MNTCAAVVGGVSLDDVDISKQAVIQGVVSKKGIPVEIGYVRLLDRSEEFVAEVPVSKSGEFRFFANSGDWKVVALVPGGSARLPVSAKVGQITELEVSVG